MCSFLDVQLLSNHGLRRWSEYRDDGLKARIVADKVIAGILPRGEHGIAFLHAEREMRSRCFLVPEAKIKPAEIEGRHQLYGAIALKLCEDLASLSGPAGETVAVARQAKKK